MEYYYRVFFTVYNAAITLLLLESLEKSLSVGNAETIARW